MKQQVLSSVFVIEIALIISAVLAGCQTQSDRLELCFELPKRNYDLGLVDCGEHIIEVPIYNRSAKSRRLLGVEAMCDLDCCYSPINVDGEVTIAPHSRFDLQLSLLVKRPVAISESVRIFLEDVGTRTETITFVGTGFGDEIKQNIE